MQLEDYFEFEKFETKFGPVERIRIKGSRLRIDTILEAFLEGATPEQIQQSYPTASREEVYATITYYLHNKEAVDAYLRRGEEIAEAYYREYKEKGPYFLRDKARSRITPPHPTGSEAPQE
jgi:uncharacterized protein (DUF433 family)